MGQPPPSGQARSADQWRGVPQPPAYPPAAPVHHSRPSYTPAPLAPPYPPAPGTAGDRGLFRGRTGVFIATLTAALLVVAGGTWYMLSDGDDGRKAGFATSGETTRPKDTPAGEQADGKADEQDLNARRKPGEARVLFATRTEADLPGDGAYAFGPWIIGDTVVTALYREVVGYSVTDGRKKWSVKLDSDVCLAAPQHSPDGRIVIGVMNGYTDKSVCADLQMIDAKNGRAGWRKPIPQSQDIPGFSDFILALSGNTVTAAGLDTSVGFDVADGRQLFGTTTSGCARYGFAGGSRLLAAAECTPADDEVFRQELQEVDPVTGRTKWSHRLEADWTIGKVISVSPVVVFVHKEDIDGAVTDRQVIALTDDGRLRSRIPFGDDMFEPRCSSTGSTEFRADIQGWCSGAAADSSTVYLATKGETTNEVVTFDLDTGKATGRSSPGSERTMLPLLAEDGGVVQYIGPSIYAGGAVSVIAPSGGARKVLLKLPRTDAEGFHEARAVYGDGRLFLLVPLVSALRDSAERETNIMMAFGR